MDIDELSELAECLIDACEKAEKLGLIVTPNMDMNANSCCPMGALILPRYRPLPSLIPAQNRYPLPNNQILLNILGDNITEAEISDFMAGFDGLARFDYVRSTTFLDLGNNIRIRFGKAIKDNYHYGECPDCGDDIPEDMVDGGECDNCGHVFL